MSVQSRRDVLTAGIAGAAISTLHAVARPFTPATAAERAEFRPQRERVPCPFVDFDPLPTEYDRELCELLLFRKRCLACAAPYDDAALAMVIPFATLPMNVYTCLPKAVLDIPEPDIPLLHRDVLAGMSRLSQVLLRIAVRRLKLLPAGAETVENITLQCSDGQPAPLVRVLSPCYVADIEEPGFSMRTTAYMFLDAIAGIYREWGRVMSRTAASFKSAPRVTRPLRQLQVRPLQLEVSMDAFVLSCMAWTTGAAVVSAESV